MVRVLDLGPVVPEQEMFSRLSGNHPRDLWLVVPFREDGKGRGHRRGDLKSPEK